MKALIAWFLVGMTYNTRTVYVLMGEIATRRAYTGTNPLLLMLDGFLLTLAGVLLFALPVVGIVFFPLTSLWLVVMKRREWHQIRNLTHSGRVKWGSGTIAEPTTGTDSDPMAEAIEEPQNEQ
jgi:UPF0716 family protein affecting phage T7 exclusion